MEDQVVGGESPDVQPEVVELTLDSVLDDETGSDTEVKAEKPAKEVEAEAEKPAEEAKPDETVDDSPSESDQKVPLAGLLDEREKRQALQKQLDEAQAKINELTAEPEAKRPSVFENEDEAFSSLEDSVERKVTAQKFELSRDMMSMLKDDYEEVEAEFLELAAGDDSLRVQLLQHPNPARFAYETALKRRELKALENVDEFREKTKAEIREEVRQEVLAELKAAQEKDAEKDEAAIPSLANSRNAGGGNNERIVDDLTVDDILEG